MKWLLYILARRYGLAVVSRRDIAELQQRAAATRSVLDEELNRHKQELMSWSKLANDRQILIDDLIAEVRRHYIVQADMRVRRRVEGVRR